ncbi:hypothetical protein U0070_015283 [Myodes glareolus]|uniref:Uncharacterized protein n=1 Tax=Myodes glareolus TaxID=447135 RepID=A0AAW0K0U6_MYOGA
MRFGNKALSTIKERTYTLVAYNGHHQALKVLLQSLVDLDIRDEKGRTALYLAAFKGHTECVEALVNQGASIFVKDNVIQRTPLHASDVIDAFSPEKEPQSLRLLNRGGGDEWGGSYTVISRVS